MAFDINGAAFREPIEVPRVLSRFPTGGHLPTSFHVTDVKAHQVPPYIQIWGRATARDASFLGRMLSPAGLRRLADAGEGIHVEYHPDGLIVGERHTLTAEHAARIVELARDVVKLWAPVVRELTEAEERRSRPTGSA
jgi:hypothetical protein